MYFERSKRPLPLVRAPCSTATASGSLRSSASRLTAPTGCESRYFTTSPAAGASPMPCMDSPTKRLNALALTRSRSMPRGVTAIM